MGQAYTPGLLVTRSTEIVKIRELPLPGEVLVKPGDKVKATDVVLRAYRPGDLDIVRIADRLGVDPEDSIPGMRVKPGDRIERGDIVCEIKTFFGWFTSRVESPASGTVEFFTEGNAHLGIRGEPSPFEITAFIDGVVESAEPGKSVTLRNHGAVIQGIFGVGGERLGTIVVIRDMNDKVISEHDIVAVGRKIDGAILIGGRTFSTAALRKAAELGAVAVVTGSIDSAGLSEFVGYQIGVSITGDEDGPLTLIVTEGFGSLAISERIIELALTIEGRPASVNGATQVRAGAMRPEILVPDPAAADGKTVRSADEPQTGQLSVGRRVRIIRVPNFGRFAQVVELPSEPEVIPTGASVRVVRLKLEPESGDKTPGETVTVPRANVELT